ncbi:MAG TPA: fibronectin type III domain-containing protein [Candidatus Eisenbacteria bacterium]|nr:fibronectin type III domain-containing protein [Candidatus Eisenbacteria bacterium]
MHPRHRTPRAGLARTPRLALVLALVALMCGLAAPAAAQTSADSSVVLLWTAPGDDGNVGRAATYQMRYRTSNVSGTDTLTWWNAATPVTGLPTPSIAGATDSMRVRGLTPLTTYYFIIRTADEVPNWSAFSNIAVKTTSGDLTAPAAVADLTVTGQTGTSLALRWTAPGDDGTTGTAASYDIRYSTSTITAGNWNSATTVTGEPTPTAAGTVQTFTLNGLQGSRQYFVAIRTTDGSGNQSTISNVATGTTTDTVAPAKVNDLSYGPVPQDREDYEEVAVADFTEDHAR